MGFEPQKRVSFQNRLLKKIRKVEEEQYFEGAYKLSAISEDKNKTDLIHSIALAQINFQKASEDIKMNQ